MGLVNTSGTFIKSPRMKIMKNVFLSVLIICVFLGINKSIAQNKIEGLFTNDLNEFVCIDKDSISFCLQNFDAFSSYRIGVGTYLVDKNKIIITNCRSILKETATIRMTTGIPSGVQISLLHLNDEPMKFASIKFSVKDATSIKSYTYNSNEAGMLLVDSTEFQNWAGREISILVSTIGFSFEQKLILNKGNLYIIKSKFPAKVPFVVPGNTETIDFEIDEKAQRMVNIKNGEQFILQKAGECHSCLGIFEALFKN